MKFFRRGELTPACQAQLAHYDEIVAAAIGSGYPYPLRMRDWELYQILTAMADTGRDDRILDTGSFNTYLGVYLARQHSQVTVSDLLSRRCRKSLMRRVGLAPRKPTEAFYFDWARVIKRAGVALRSLDVTRIACPDASFDRVIALSVIEHVPAVERTLAEMFRVLAPGGKLFITTDCSPKPRPYHNGVRYFTAAELEEILAPYPVTSDRNPPDFSPENWCYGLGQPIVTAFVEITKPR
ncbi:MAG TPA: methyltransferase domain-containing protein [Opitutaceae bacterium]|jgi:SAM-dependent methyltransferase|nr:methyltransferase domain-containing protein [Opitutaceae bacterium]